MHIGRNAPLLKKLCTRGALRLLSRIHHIVHRMPLALHTIQPAQILVVSPHMDDEVIAAGGTLALHRQAHNAATLAFVSDCSGGYADPARREESTETRQQEARAAAVQTGMQRVEFLGFPDGKLSKFEEPISQRIADLIRSVSPSQIFCPFPTDHHRDHQATSIGVALAIEELQWSGEVWGYEVWSTMWPNTAVDITSVLDAKRQALECYESQIRYNAYVDASLGLNRYRGLQAGVHSAEGFFVCPAGRFTTLVGELAKL